jgi:hypothetical protein
MMAAKFDYGQAPTANKGTRPINTPLRNNLKSENHQKKVLSM